MSKKVEAAKPPAEELAEVDLTPEEEQQAYKEPEDGTKPVPPPDIEVDEQEAQVEQAEAPEPAKPDAATSAIMEGFSLLREELRSRGEAPPPIPVREQGENEEDFGKRVNDEIFKEDPYGILSKAIDRRARKIVEAEVGPLLGSIMESAFENAEFRLKADPEEGPIYLKFEGEIKKTLKTLTPSQQKNPQVLKAVYERVKSLHVNEIIDLKVEARMKVVKSATPVPQPRKPVAEGGSSVMPGGGSNNSNVVRIPKSELEDIKRRAAKLGIDYRELVTRRGR